jgi:hypothetical protein
MSQFTTNFKGELIGNNRWRNIEPFEYHVNTYPSDEVITVPIGFETDFASIPRIFWSILSPIDKHGKAAVIHDFCYYHGLYTRKVCDMIFREGMRVLNVKPWKATTMYYVLRVTGWYAWWKHSRRRKKEATV